jgi:acyl carrier protein
MSKNFSKLRLINLFKKQLEIKGKFNEKSQIHSYKNWDSLANFNILLSIENEFNLKFTTDEFSSLNSFKEIYQNVKQK